MQATSFSQVTSMKSVSYSTTRSTLGESMGSKHCFGTAGGKANATRNHELVCRLVDRQFSCFAPCCRYRVETYSDDARYEWATVTWHYGREPTGAGRGQLFKHWRGVDACDGAKPAHSACKSISKKGHDCGVSLAYEQLGSMIPRGTDTPKAEE
eukprot:363920-Chlamydomonas_euryale.AAC.7